MRNVELSEEVMKTSNFGPRTVVGLVCLVELDQPDRPNRPVLFIAWQHCLLQPDRTPHRVEFSQILEGPASNHGHLRAFRVLVVRGLGVLVEIGMNSAGETPNRAAS